MIATVADSLLLACGNLPCVPGLMQCAMAVLNSLVAMKRTTTVTHEHPDYSFSFCGIRMFDGLVPL